MTPTLTYTVDAGRTEPGVSVGWTRRAEIHFDTGVDLADGLFGPADLLGAAFAACLLKNVERYSHLLPFRYEGASVHVTLEREERPSRIARIRYELHVVTDEPAGRLDLLHRNLVRFGTIYNTLAASAALHAVPGITDVHDLHLWALAEDLPVVTAHLETGTGADQRRILLAATEALRRVGVDHATLQLESEPCGQGRVAEIAADSVGVRGRTTNVAAGRTRQ